MSDRVWRPRVLVLPIAAAVIVGLVVFKLSQPPQPRSSATFDERRPAPKFLALDSQNQLVKFERYLGRQEVLLIFFDGEAGADRDPVLLRARSSLPNSSVVACRSWESAPRFRSTIGRRWNGSEHFRSHCCPIPSFSFTVCGDATTRTDWRLKLECSGSTVPDKWLGRASRLVRRRTSIVCYRR